MPRLRALVVLPTRDLAAQVFRVFQTLAPAVGLRVGLAAAALPVAPEAAALMRGFPGCSGYARQRNAASAPALLSGPLDSGWHACPTAGSGSGPGFGHSGCAVDVLVATPGRLMTHLRGTLGVSLEHLRFLVRLLTINVYMLQLTRYCLQNATANMEC